MSLVVVVVRVRACDNDKDDNRFVSVICPNAPKDVKICEDDTYFEEVLERDHRSADKAMPLRWRRRHHAAAVGAAAAAVRT